MYIPLIREHLNRSIELLDALKKANCVKMDNEAMRGFLLVGMLTTMAAHMDYCVRSLDLFFERKEDENYPNNLVDNLYGLNKDIKLAVNEIYGGIMSHVASSDMPEEYCHSHTKDVQAEDIQKISTIGDKLKLAELTLGMMTK